MVYVLKCKYFDECHLTLFSHERLAVFNIHSTYANIKPKIKVSDILWPKYLEEWCIVPREDVVRRARNLGYLSLRGIRMDEPGNRAFVKIYDAQVNLIPTFIVPLDDIEVLT